LTEKRTALASDAEAAFRRFGKAVFADRTLPKESQGAERRRRRACHPLPEPHLKGHTKPAAPATGEEIMEAIRDASEVRAVLLVMKKGRTLAGRERRRTRHLAIRGGE
jgi:hypothetical protein